MEMKKYSRLLAIVMLIMVVKPAYCAAIDGDEMPDAPPPARTEAQLYYDQIPIEKRDIFIRYYLGEGLKEQGYHIVRSPRIVMIDAEADYGTLPDAFAGNLLTWFKIEYGVNDDSVKRMAENSYVSLPPGCLYPQDVGCACCPFN